MRGCVAVVARWSMLGDTMAERAGAAGPRRAARLATPRGRARSSISPGNGSRSITEDWRWRMVTPPKGDTASVPLNPAGRKAADAWDLAADRARGDLCKAFGPPGVDSAARTRCASDGRTTTRCCSEFDAGTQTRRFTSGTAVAGGARSLQGQSAGAVVPAAAESRHLRPRRRGARRLARSRDDEPACRLSAPERRALQRAYGRQGVLRQLHAAGGRRRGSS